MDASDEPYDFLTWHSNVPVLKDEKKEKKKEKKEKKEQEKLKSALKKKKSSKKSTSDSEASDSDEDQEKSKSKKTLKKTKAVKKQVEKEDSSSSSSSSDSSSSEDSDDPNTQPPPKSKKKKNRKKKTKKAGLDASDDEDAAAPENDDGETEGASKKKKKEKKEGPGRKGEFGIWIGNMSFLTTEKALRHFFRDVGAEITRVNMPSGSGYNKKGNKGFAYVDFSSAEGQVNAIALSEQELEGRKVLIKSSKSFDGRPIVSKTSVHDKAAKQKHAVSPTLFVGNLSFQTTRESLQGLFGDCGEIRKVRLATFEDSGKCKGFAYIDYMAPESATAALTDPKKHFLDGRRLNVEYASAEATLKGNPREYRKRKREEADAEAIARGEVPPSQKEQAEEEAAAAAAEEERRQFNAEQKAKRQRRQPGEAPAKKLQGHQRPGFALANAQRASQGITEFKGSKVTF